MSLTQLVTPNLQITYTGGWCLKAVADAFGVPWNLPDRYAEALADWNANEGNHPGELPPAGVYVPVYFSLGDVPAGHIAIALPDGRVASSTFPGVHQGLYIHPSLNDLIAMYAPANGGCTYLGWSETVDKLSVVTQPADQGAAADMDPHQIARDLYQTLTGQVPSDDIIQQKADFIASSGNCQQVIKDILAAGLATNETVNLWGLQAYDSARGGADPVQFAKDRFYGGDNLPAVFNKDLPAYKADEAQVGSLQQQVTDLTGKLQTAQASVTAAQEAQHTAEAKLAEATTQVPTPAPAPEPAPTAPTPAAVSPEITACQQAADQVTQIALEKAHDNPWPLLWAKIKEFMTREVIFK